MLTRAEELDAMKRIDLPQFVATRGFVFDKRNSSRCSIVMRHVCGDKLIISKTRSGHHVYFNATGGGSDSGTIIDFLTIRERLSLGEVRKVLRPWLIGGSTLPDLPTLPIQLQPSEHDAAKVLATWMKAQPIGVTHVYLEKERKIPRHVLTHPIFADRIRRDDRQNALFLHHNLVGICGAEIKNRGFTGFIPGGVKGLASSRPRPSDRQMVVFETAIDLLSYAALKGIDGNRFFSTAGQISPTQGECLRSAVAKMPTGSRVVLACDNDEGGYKLAQQVESELAITGIDIIRDFPSRPGDDWNDVLRREPTAHPAPVVSP